MKFWIVEWGAWQEHHGMAVETEEAAALARITSFADQKDDQAGCDEPQMQSAERDGMRILSWQDRDGGGNWISATQWEVAPPMVKVEPPTHFHDLRDGVVKPGMLLWFVDHDEPLLVGEINDVGGVCDCCNGVEGIIRAYQQVWEPATPAETKDGDTDGK